MKWNVDNNSKNIGVRLKGFYEYFQYQVVYQDHLKLYHYWPVIYQYGAV